MNSIYYHGTDAKSAAHLAGPPSAINVKLGGGELGMGFYTGNVMHIAASWAWERSKKFNVVPCIIEIEIDPDEILKLTVNHIKTRDDVIRIYDMLLATDRERVQKMNYDYTVAPFISIDSALQIKFESEKAETILNNSKIIIRPCA